MTVYVSGGFSQIYNDALAPFKATQKLDTVGSFLYNRAQNHEQNLSYQCSKTDRGHNIYPKHNASQKRASAKSHIQNPYVTYSRRESNAYALRRAIFASFAKSRLARSAILLQLALTKSIKNFNAGGCFAVLSQQIFCRCKEKMRSNIRYCKHFICRRCGYLSHKTV